MNVLKTENKIMWSIKDRQVQNILDIIRQHTIMQYNTVITIWKIRFLGIYMKLIISSLFASGERPAQHTK